MLYKEIIAVCSQIHTKHINTLCGQNAELLNVKLAVYTVTAGLQLVNEAVSTSDCTPSTDSTAGEQRIEMSVATNDVGVIECNHLSCLCILRICIQKLTLAGIWADISTPHLLNTTQVGPQQPIMTLHFSESVLSNPESRKQHTFPIPD